MGEAEHSDIKRHLEIVENKVGEMNNNLVIVLQAISGNPLTKDGGMVQDLSEIKLRLGEFEKRLSSLEQFKNKIHWTVGLFIAAGSFIGAFIGLIISYFSYKK